MPSLTSRLDAVNTVLTASGESPVSSLTGTTADAANADAIIEEVLRDVQSEGWHFNTEKDVPLVPDVSKNITLPPNVISVDVSTIDFPKLDVVQRGNRLYDKASRSFAFDAPIKAEIVYLLPFEEIPEPARRYVAIRAARVFHDRFVGDARIHSFTSEDEQRARISLTSSNASNADANIFKDSPWTRAMLRRR